MHRPAFVLLALAGCTGAHRASNAPAPSPHRESNAPAPSHRESNTPAPPPAPAPQPFSRIQARPITDDARYARCHWSSLMYAPCGGVQMQRRAASVCNDCALDADCRSGERCIAVVAPGWDRVPVQACVPAGHACAASHGCGGTDTCVVADGGEVACRPIEICSAQ